MTLTNRSADRRWGPLAALLLVVGVMMQPATARAASGDADAALTWIQRELDANGGTMPGFTPGSTDWGLTADAALALLAHGRGGTPEVGELIESLVGGVDEYSTWDHLGPGLEGVRLSGALAKILLVVVNSGGDPVVDGWNLESELRDLMQTSGEERGRFSDRNPHADDNSNAFGQSLAMLALSSTDDSVPDDSISFLVDQQCPGGGFRLFYSGSPGCIDASAADPDATAMAIQALMVVERTDAVEAALGAAVAWLLAIQFDDGSFGGSGPTAAANSNSTGLVAHALSAAGLPTAATRAADWLVSEVQLDEVAVAGSPVAGDVGAIAYNPGRRLDALERGISAAGRDQWRRATTQAVLGLGAAPFGQPVGGPVDPGPISPPVMATPTTAPPPTPAPPPTTALPSGGRRHTTPAPASPSAPARRDLLPVVAGSGVGSSPPPASSIRAAPPLPQPSAAKVAGSSTSGAGAARVADSASGVLAATGTTTMPSVVAGVGLVVLGLLALVLHRVVLHRVRGFSRRVR